MNEIFEQLSELLSLTTNIKDWQAKLQMYNKFVEDKGEKIAPFIGKNIQALNTSIENNNKNFEERVSAFLNQANVAKVENGFKETYEKLLDTKEYNYTKAAKAIELKSCDAEWVESLPMALKLNIITGFVRARTMEYVIAKEGVEQKETISLDETNTLLEAAKNFGLEMIIKNDIGVDNDYIFFKDPKTSMLVATYKIKFESDKIGIK